MIAHAAEPRAGIVGVSDRALLAELKIAVGDAPGAPSSDADARRRAHGAASDAEALLRSEGYYAAQVTGDVTAGEPARPVVHVELGPRFHIKGGKVEWVGTAPTAQARAAAETAALILPGTPGRAADVISAESRAVAALKAAGYADASPAPRQVVVDYADNSVEPTFRLEPKALVRLGEVRLSGKTRISQRFIRRLAPWSRGDVYAPAKLAKLERRLIDAGVFEGVSVSLAPEESGDRPRPVLVSLNDRKPRSVEIGAGYSTAQPSTVDVGFGAAYSTGEGSGVDGAFRLYNRLRRADTLSFTAILYDIQQKLDAELALPDFLRADQILRVGGGFVRDRTPAYDEVGGGVRASIERHWTKTTFVTLGAAFDYESTFEKDAVNSQAIPVGQTLNIFITTGIFDFALDRSNDPLNPVRGFRLDGRAEPTYIAGDRTIGYLKLLGQASGYVPLDKGAETVIAARFRVGSILGGAIPDVPADRRFLSGGGGSVRGYGYQLVGPRLSDNTPEGGLSLVEASVEARRHVIGPWSVAAFADVGAVGETIAPSFKDYGLGVGLGIRYNLGFAPFRLDVATPLRRQKGDAPVQVYISLGQSF